MRKADGKPMCRQQIHMLRKKAKGICLICTEPAIGVYCLKHTVVVRECMRRKNHYGKRLRNSMSYVAEQRTGKKVPSRRR